jgi:hypothetical protein
MHILSFLYVAFATSRAPVTSATSRAPSENGSSFLNETNVTSVQYDGDVKDVDNTDASFASALSSHNNNEKEISDKSIYHLAQPMLHLSKFIYDFVDLRREAKAKILELAEELKINRLKAIRSFVNIDSSPSKISHTDREKFKKYFGILSLPKKASAIEVDSKLHSEELLQGRKIVDDDMGHFLSEYEDAYLEHVDDDHTLPEFGCELTYAIAVSDRLKSITVVFRGTKNTHDWVQNFKVKATDLVLPGYRTTSDVADSADQEEKSFGKVHKGFYKYLFGETGSSGISKGEKIIDSLKKLLKEKEGYDLYFTGHSLGGAVSTMMAFRAAVLDEFKDTNIINVSFASPFVGNHEFRENFESLERKKKLKHLRVSNHEDVVPLLPYCTFTRPVMAFKHVGVNVKLQTIQSGNIKDSRISYPKRGSFLTELSNAMNGNLLRRLRVKSIPYHSCGEYAKRLEVARQELEQITLDEKYSDPQFTGWNYEENDS